MKVYHGSLERVEIPEIRPANRTLDYGFGFYVTTSYEQAEAWVKRRMGGHKVTKGYVNEYSLDNEKIEGLNVLSFNEPTEEWLDFVMANRTNKDFIHFYDWYMAQWPMIVCMRHLPFMKEVYLTSKL